ncbi:hypothetical protein HS088_TW14G00260 [Tripterygium wilfordii]|uniref:Uncharacterized protein n=1 Tax=Tripterygium wilfordii TaxID=458696 RepID=A0A7J7CPU4_TRIWF|nr:hypothetical protein HS088_TW14G00260 [Tripterygium wilfordii]
MARLICACGFILVLILCHEVVHVEGRGRHLKSHLCKKCNSRHHKNTLNAAAKAGDHHLTGSAQERTSKVEYVDAFRPTAPGHSPGVGHSINN